VSHFLIVRLGRCDVKQPAANLFGSPFCVSAFYRPGCAGDQNNAFAAH